MPLPVERSQGSVQSLVARFQTAADRDKEAARRQSLPGPRRSSSYGVAKPEASPQPAEKDILPAQDGQASAAPANGTKEAKGPVIEGVKNKVQELAQGVKDITIGGGSGAKQANEEMSKEDDTKMRSAGPSSTAGSSKSSTAKPTSTVPAPTTPLKSPKTAGVKSAQPSTKSPLSHRKELSSGSASGKATASGSAKLNPRNAASPTAIKSPAPGHRKDLSSTSNQSISSTSATKPRSSSTITRPSAAGSKSPVPAKQPATRTPRLIPSATGPPRKTPSSTSSFKTDVSPLRPQLTGTPVKPTASSLAKSRTPGNTAERPRAVSGSRTSGARPSSASPSPAPGSTPGFKSSASKPSLPSSGSRLLQGTAASRAKTAEMKSSPSTQKPTPTKTGSGRSTAGASKPLVAKVRSVSGKTEAESKGDTPASESKVEREPAVIGPPTGTQPDSTEGDNAPATGPSATSPSDDQSLFNPLENARIGFAAAGADKGGETGKDYNDKVIAEKRVAQDDRIEHKDEPQRVDEIEVNTEDDMQFNPLAGVRQGFAAAGADKRGETGMDFNDAVQRNRNSDIRPEDDVGPAAADDDDLNPLAHVRVGFPAANAGGARSGSPEGVADNKERVSQTELEPEGDAAGGETETGHGREPSAGSLQEIPDVA